MRREAEQRERNRQAEAVTQAENERQRQTAINLLATELPNSDKANLAPLAEYEKIDGFHDKPLGADKLLQEMQLEEIEAAEQKVDPRITQLKLIESQRNLSQQASNNPNGEGTR